MTSQPPRLLHRSTLLNICFSNAWTWFLLLHFRPLSGPQIYHRYREGFFPPFLSVLTVVQSYCSVCFQSFSSLKNPSSFQQSVRACYASPCSFKLLWIFSIWCGETDAFLILSILAWFPGSITSFASQDLWPFPHSNKHFISPPTSLTIWHCSLFGDLLS